jgi:hypothetical protein
MLSPPSDPRGGADGSKGEGERAPSVLRSTGAETVEPLFQREEETYALTFAHQSKMTL